MMKIVRVKFLCRKIKSDTGFSVLQNTTWICVIHPVSYLIFYSLSVYMWFVIQVNKCNHIKVVCVSFIIQMVFEICVSTDLFRIYWDI